MGIFGGGKTFEDLMDEYYSESNPLKQYKILQQAAAVAKDDLQKLQVVTKINQIKADHGL